MSNTDQVEETSENFEAVLESEKKTAPNKLRFFGLAGLGVTTFVAAMVYSLYSVDETPSSNVSRPPNLDTTPGGFVQENSEEYRKSLAAENDRAADEAARRGQSFAASPEVVPEKIDQSEGRLGDASANPTAVPLSEREQMVQPASISVTRVPTVQRSVSEQEVQPEPARVRVPVNREASSGIVTSNQTVNPSQPQEENPYVQLIVRQADDLFAQTMPRESSTVSFDEAALDGPEAVSAFADEETLRDFEERQREKTGRDEEDLSDAEGVFVRAGDILYAEMINSVSSDAMMSVVAEVTVGEYRGARVIGSFAVDDAYNGLVVEFNQMVLQDGSSLDITALAVDGRNAEASISSDIDGRYLQRYGGILASAFIGGYAASASQRAEEQTISGDNVIVTSDSATNEQSLYAGAAAAASAISADLGESRPTTPRVNLRRGHPLALLFISSTNEDRSSDLSGVSDD